MTSRFVWVCALAMAATACGSSSKSSGGSQDDAADASAPNGDDVTPLGDAASPRDTDGSASGDDGSAALAGNDAGADDGGSTDGGHVGDGSTDGGTDGGEPVLPGQGSGTTYYVSTAGSDAANGLSPTTPWQTIAKIAATTFHAGDAVLLKGGDMFTGCLVLQNSRVQSTRAAPFTVGSYGTGRFTLTANCTGTSDAPVAAITLASLNGMVLQDAIVVGNSGGASIGVWIYNGTSVQTGGVVVRNSDVSGFYDGTGMKYGSEIFITSSGATSTTVATSMDDIRILNNVLHGTAGPTSPDDNGINGFGHGNITHVVYDGNLVYDIGSHPNAPAGAAGNGILAIGVNGAVLQHNVVHDVGANTNTCGGPAGLWTFNANNALLQFNEVYAVHPVNKTTGCDWGAYDFDLDTTNSVMQYNYSHDNYAEGYLMYGTGGGAWGTNVMRYNVSENDSEGIILNLDHGMAANIYNNTVYVDAAHTANATPIAFDIASHAPNMGLVANNIFYVAPHGTDASQLLKTNGLDPTGLVFRDNDYYASSKPTIEWKGVSYTSVAAWTTATSVDPSALAVDPQFVAGGATGTCTHANCGSGYRIAPTSPALGTGLNLTHTPYSLDVGMYDFLGGAIPSGIGTGYNVGALGSNP